MGRYLLTVIVLAACAAGVICLFLTARGASVDTLRGSALPRVVRPEPEAARNDPPPVSALGDDVPGWVWRADPAAKTPGDVG